MAEFPAWYIALFFVTPAVFIFIGVRRRILRHRAARAAKDAKKGTGAS